MPELIVYDKRNRRVHVNSAVRYRGMRVIVSELIDSKTVKVRIGGMIQAAKADKIELIS